MLPKRFNEAPSEHGHMAMAAFSVPPSNPPPVHASRERQLERLRKMEEKISAMRREQRVQQEQAAAAIVRNDVSPALEVAPITPKRIKRNGLAIYVCDISQLLAKDPSIEWQETKNSGLIAGAPDHFTFSTMVSGNGELIVFGGINKNPKSESSSVTNSIHFLTVPTTVV